MKNMYLQPLNVSLRIVVTRGGILISEKVHELNEYSPTLSTLSDSLMDEIFAYEKARLPISVTVAGVPIRASVMECIFPDPSEAFVELDMGHNTVKLKRKASYITKPIIELDILQHIARKCIIADRNNVGMKPHANRTSPLIYLLFETHVDIILNPSTPLRIFRLQPYPRLLAIRLPSSPPLFDTCIHPSPPVLAILAILPPRHLPIHIGSPPHMVSSSKCASNLPLSSRSALALLSSKLAARSESDRSDRAAGVAAGAATAAAAAGGQMAS